MSNELGADWYRD